ncbi:hypothetical protein IJG29_03930 [Candidatus Saccharibacteria bacterium]|nr:hypothetical protein [Candidatus Saccharibacteria bacterium]
MCKKGPVLRPGVGDEECQCDRCRRVFVRDDDSDLGGVAVDNELIGLVMLVSMTISIARAGLPGAIQKAVGKCRTVSEFALVGAARREQTIQTSREDGGVAPHAADNTGADQIRGTDGICERIVWVQQKKPLLS